MQTEGQAAHSGRDAGRQQGIARGTAQALADPVGKAQHGNPEPTGSKGDQGPRETGQGVAPHHPGLGALGTIHDHAGEELQEAGGGLGDTLDQPQGAGAGHQDRGQIERHQRIDHLGGAVIEQADQANQPDGAGQGEQGS